MKTEFQMHKGILEKIIPVLDNELWQFESFLFDIDENIAEKLRAVYMVSIQKAIEVQFEHHTAIAKELRKINGI